MAGGRVEHHSRKRELELYIDSLFKKPKLSRAELNEFDQIEEGLWEVDRNG
jgi:hypothetical protein